MEQHKHNYIVQMRLNWINHLDALNFFSSVKIRWVLFSFELLTFISNYNVCKNKWISWNSCKKVKVKNQKIIESSLNHKINEYKTQKIKRKFNNILMCMHVISIEINDKNVSATICEYFFSMLTIILRMIRYE